MATITNVGSMALRRRPTRRVLNSSLLNRFYSSSQQRPSWSERFHGASAPVLMSAYAPVPQAARNPRCPGLKGWLISMAAERRSTITFKSLPGLNGLVERRDLDQRHVGTHPVEIAAVVRRDEEGRRTSFLGRRDLLLNPANCLHIAGRRDLSGAGKMATGQQRSSGDL